MNAVATPSLTFARRTCRLCGASALNKAVPLPALPVASPNVGRGPTVAETAPADLHQCGDCGFMQLETVVNPEFQYRDFRYSTGISLGLREHFGDLVRTLARRGDIGPGRFVFDIGSNDGSLLRVARELGARVLGIDPAERIARAATAGGIPTIGDFFTAAKGRAVAAAHGPADVVVSNNTVANIDDLDDFFRGIDAVLAPAGLVVIETQYALDVLEKTLLDVIYHEHVSYFAVAPMRRFLAARGFELVDAETIAPKGGSIRFLAQRRGGPRAVGPRVGELIAREERAGLYSGGLFDAFNARVATVGRELRARLAASRETTGRALAYGASVGCAALVHYFGLAPHLDAVYDDTPLTDCLRTGQGGIPVLGGAELAKEPPTDVAVLAWRYADAIAERQQEFRRAGGRFYRALPDLAFVGG